MPSRTRCGLGMLIKYNFGAHLGLEFWYLVMFCILMIRGMEPRGTGGRTSLELEICIVKVLKIHKFHYIFSVGLLP